MKKIVTTQLWENFDARQTTAAHGNAGCLINNPVSKSVPAGSTHWDAIQTIANEAAHPFKVRFVSRLLKEHRSVHGNTLFGYAGDLIDQILQNYAMLRWWMESDGLVIDRPRPSFARLKEFDLFAGPLVVSKWKNGRLPKEDLLEISKQIDSKGFQLKATLEAAQWKPISTHNQKNAHMAIKLFETAAKHPQFVRAIRRRLYRARERYLRAQAE